MSKGHAHGAERRLGIALALTVTFLVVEVVVGLWSGSLALLSDAAHMLTDSGALVLALTAQRLASRPRTGRHTFGLRRAEILAALANGVALGLGAIWVIAEGVQRWSAPVPIHGGSMLGVAIGGLVVNLLAAFVLGGGHDHGPHDHGHHDHAHHEHEHDHHAHAARPNMNVRAAMLHVLSDAAGSAAAIVAAICVLLWDLRQADVLASLAIALLVLVGSVRLVRETVPVLLEATPTGIDPVALEATIRGTPGVCALHDLHVWAITEGFPVVTVHVVLDGSRHGTDVAQEVAARLRVTHGIDHATVQPEARPPDVLVPLHPPGTHA